MNTRATLYAVVTVVLSVVMVPWACAGGEKAREKDEMEREAERHEQQEVMADAQDRDADVLEYEEPDVYQEPDGQGDVAPMGDATREDAADAMNDTGDEMIDAGDTGIDVGEEPGLDIDAGDTGIDVGEEPGLDDESPGGAEGDRPESRRGGPGDDDRGGRTPDDSEESGFKEIQFEPDDSPQQETFDAGIDEESLGDTGLPDESYDTGLKGDDSEPGGAGDGGELIIEGEPDVRISDDAASYDARQPQDDPWQQQDDTGISEDGTIYGASGPSARPRP